MMSDFFFLSGIFYEKELAEDKEIMKQTQLPSDSLDSIHRESTHSELWFSKKAFLDKPTKVYFVVRKMPWFFLASKISLLE